MWIVDKFLFQKLSFFFHIYTVILPLIRSDIPSKMCNDDEDDECCDCGCSPTFERRFMLTLVFSLITFCYVSYYFISVIPWEWYKTQWGWFNIILFNTFVGLLMVSYLKSIFTNAGEVPKDYVRFNKNPSFIHFNRFSNNYIKSLTQKYVSFYNWSHFIYV